MLAALGLTYGTDTANEFATEVHKTLAIEAYRSSVNMAKERMPFMIYDSQREKNNPFIERLRQADPEMVREMENYGRRNISLLTIAPTGTTSLMTQTTSGIEPVFRPFYTRRRKVNPNDPEVRVDFVDEQGDKWEEYKVFHHKFLTWLQINKYDVEEVKNMSNDQVEELVKKSPYYKATAADIDYLSKVRMQGAIQKWVDHSISVTINMPENVSEEIVEECYFEAWKCGCKGITVYREGSRAGVLISDDKNNQQAKQMLELKRPKVLDADIVRFRNDDEEWIAFVGLLNGMPYEIFTGRVEEDTLNIPKAIENGRIIKERDAEGNNRYDFQYTNRYGYATTFQGLSHQFDKTFWNYAKLISGVLRHGMAIDKAVELVSSLEFDNDSINTWKRGVERALRKYIPNGTKASKKGDICEGCQQEDTQVYQDGCVICTECGHSKCS
jgi:ribonucleoside-diphosphate reductase alpha chain